MYGQGHLYFLDEAQKAMRDDLYFLSGQAEQSTIIPSSARLFEDGTERYLEDGSTIRITE